MRTLVILLLWSSTVWACPACVSAGNQKYIIQTIIAVSVMCVIPLTVAGFVVWQISRIQKHDKQPSVSD